MYHHYMAELIEQDGMNVLPSGLVDRKDAARYLGRRPQTLAHWACNDKGPPFVTVMGRVFYRVEDLRAFVGVA